METFIEKFRNSYHLSENDTQTLLSYMEEIRFKKKEVIVHEGSKNGNLYLIKQGIWRAHYLKDGVDTTIWFAGAGEAAFSVWGYVENTASHITIEVMCDSIAYCIPGSTPEQSLCFIARTRQPGTTTDGTATAQPRKLADQRQKPQS